MTGRYLKEFFKFTRGESIGILMLFLILLGLIGVRIWLPGIKPKSSTDFEAYHREIQGWLKSDSLAFSKKNDAYQPEQVKSSPEPILFFFDPNKINLERLEQMGITGKLAYTWLKYLRAGGRFVEKEDMKKIYGMGDSVYFALEKYIQIERPESPPEERVSRELLISPRGDPEMIDLNRIDSSELSHIPGLSPVLSGRIIRYRNWLGGFSKPEQLLEVYGFPHKIFFDEKYKLRTDTMLLRKMNLNTITRKSLSRHPYLNPYQAGAIIKYRELKGAFTTVNELLLNHLIPLNVYVRVRPYLQVKPDLVH